MKHKKKNILAIISVLIPAALFILILNLFLEVVPLESIQGLPLALPLFLCPIGAMIGFIAYIDHKDRLSIISIIFNLILFSFPIAYNIFVTLVFGV